MQRKNYIDQHESIAEEIHFIKESLKLDLTDDLSGDVAKHINILAGKLSVHLSMEDKHLYPHLLEKQDNEINSSVQFYMNEMSNLANEFTTYKEKYNTKYKLLQNKDNFNKETINILNKISERINREEETIYKYID